MISEKIKLSLYLTVFFLLWSIYGYFISPKISEDLFFVNITIKFLVWVVPVYCYLKFVDKVDVLEYLRLKTNVLKNVLIGFLVVLPFAIIPTFASLILKNHGINFNLSLSDWFSGVLMAGFAEEILFRGFIFQKLQLFFNLPQSILINSILFLVIHFPNWFSRGLFTWFYAGFILVFGLITCVLFKFSKSLWTTMTFHWLNNFCSLLK